MIGLGSDKNSIECFLYQNIIMAAPLPSAFFLAEIHWRTIAVTVVLWPFPIISILY